MTNNPGSDLAIAHLRPRLVARSDPGSPWLVAANEGRRDVTTEPREVMRPLEAFNLMGWIEQNADRIIPPISNETIFKGNDDFIVMVSIGPNSRKDYHDNQSEELFLQLKGDVEIGLYRDGQLDAVAIREGEMLLVPPHVPHQPRRPPNTIGLIIEKHRAPSEKDGFMYFCDGCHAKLYEEHFFLEDIVRQLPMVQRNFYGSVERRTCRECGQVMELPPDWDERIEVRAQDNPYADDPYADVQGRSW